MANHEKIIVFYHSPCLDGAAAAWAAYQKWGDSAQYVGINHGSVEAQKKLILDHLDEETHAVFADYTPPRALMDEIASSVSAVTVYDHHASAIRSMQGYEHEKVTLVMDEDRSGAAIVWDELFNNKKHPQVIDMAQMIDLEQTNRKDFFSIAACFDSFPIGDINEALASLETLNKLSKEDIIERGASIRQSNATSIDKTLNSKVWTKVSILPGTDPVYVPIINANPHHLGREYSIKLRQIAENSPPAFAALSWYEDKGIVRISVRTGGIPDAGKIAAHIGDKESGRGLGGGGHPASAAAQCTIKQFNAQFPRMTQAEVLEDLMTSKSHVMDNASA